GHLFGDVGIQSILEFGVVGGQGGGGDGVGVVQFGDSQRLNRIACGNCDHRYTRGDAAPGSCDGERKRKTSRSSNSLYPDWHCGDAVDLQPRDQDGDMKKLCFILVLAAILSPGIATGASSVVISEFMASNNSTLADEDGEYSDWIELYNSSTNTVNLGGWYVTDRATNLTHW